MIDELTEQEEQLLAGARRGLSPSPADAQRVLAATMLAVTAPAMVSIAHGSTTTPAAASTTATVAAPSSPALPAATAAASSASAGVGAGKVIAAIAFAALTGVIGYQLGYRTAEREQEQEQARALRSPAAEPTRIEQPVARGVSPARSTTAAAPATRDIAGGAPAATPELAAAAAVAVVLDHDVVASTQEPAAASDATPTHAATSRVHAALAAKPGADGRAQRDEPARTIANTNANTNASRDPVDTVTAVSSSLERELQALRKIERALRAGDAKLALELNDTLDRDVPQGKLLEERAATAVLARCSLGLGSKRHLRNEFISAYPASVYRNRVEQSCADETKP